MSSKKKQPHTAKKPGSTYERYTPPRYLEAARQVMGVIDLDPASCVIANQNVKATKFYTEEENGLTKEWRGNIWLNPPYSIVESFVDKLIESNFKQAIVLTHNCTETKWFCKLVDRADAIVFPTHRINFLNSDGTASSALPLAVKLSSTSGTKLPTSSIPSNSSAGELSFDISRQCWENESDEIDEKFFRPAWKKFVGVLTYVKNF